MKKKQKKPTGKVLPYIVTKSGFAPAPGKFIFPESKEEIEEKVAKLFLNEATKIRDSGFSNDLNLNRNMQDDLDFRIIQNGAEYYLELTEITPQKDMRGGYINLPDYYNIGSQAQIIIDLILKKTKKYSPVMLNIILLMYITDNKAGPSPLTIKLVQDFCNKQHHFFKQIWYFFPIMEDSGAIIQFFPNNVDPLSKSQIQELKDSTVENINL